MATIRVNGLDVHVQRLGHTGDAPRPVVVLIHGLLIDSLASYYFSLAPRLAEEGMDVVMYDLRGHGKTSRPPTGYLMEDFVTDLDELLDALAVDRPVHLVGNSFGGAVAYAMAAAHPDRVASVVAIEAEPPARAWQESMYAGLVEGNLVIERVTEWLRENPGERNARPFRAAGKMLDETTVAQEIPQSRLIDDDLSAIRCPVFALYGGTSVLAAQAVLMEAALADCRAVVLPDRGHSLMVEATKETYDLVRDWLFGHETHALREAR
ncbi:alpha/beta hydrolase [Streptomyces sp. NBC_00243]|uniref:alpha/beta fold hydrolase n=1 Tax=Streptomyces sp. NBC_00243 TaxID=2975688 RepID=UPI002DDBFAAB|nr:alpha/beta hydrolase [Streptomyces sp. NBC_00243]WRZ17861.1 alpha/beta hydrolase [Streptomyces sp. NBC_00243]